MISTSNVWNEAPSSWNTNISSSSGDEWIFHVPGKNTWRLSHTYRVYFDLYIFTKLNHKQEAVCPIDLFADITQLRMRSHAVAESALLWLRNLDRIGSQSLAHLASSLIYAQWQRTEFTYTIMAQTKTKFVLRIRHRLSSHSLRGYYVMRFGLFAKTSVWWKLKSGYGDILGTVEKKQTIESENIIDWIRCLILYRCNDTFERRLIYDLFKYLYTLRGDFIRFLHI